MKNHVLKKILSDLEKKNIAIIGHMGSGKSIIGKILAKRFDFKHFDSDKEISKYTQKSINDIFYEKGEKYFRNIEKNILLDLIEKKNVVLSLGGGAILNKLIRDELKNKSVTIFLDVNINKLEKRLKNSNNRPLLKNVDIKKRIKNLDSIRRKYYLLADIRLNNTDNSPYITCKNLIEKLINLYEKTN